MPHRLASLVAIALCCAVTPAAAREGPAKPNVLLILVDDLRSDLGCYGKSQVKTPHIDSLAARGMRFDRAYVQATVCNPSRASLLTGLRPDTTGVHRNRVYLGDTLPDAVTLPRLFKQNGYRTLRLGKIFHGRQKFEHPEAWDVIHYGEGTPSGRQGRGRNLTEERIDWCYWLAAEGGDDDQPDGQLARAAAEFLAGKPDQPFFLAIGFYKPHDPWIAPAAYFDLYSPEEIAPHSAPPDSTRAPPEATFGPWQYSFNQFTDRERKELLHAYYATTSFVDAQVGRVLSALEQAGLERNTVVLLAGDHGYHLGEHGWWHKDTLYEVSARAPLIVYAPAMQAKGRSCQGLIEFVDIFPTLAELAGLPVAANVEGRSFVPLLDDPQLPWKQAAFTQVRRKGGTARSVRTPRWRYTEWDVEGERNELYDHDADPGEYHNLADDVEYAAFVRDLRELIRAPAASDAVVVFGDFANPPFSSWNEAGEAVGLEVEILAEVGQNLGRPVVWRERPFVELVPSAADGTAHIAASTLGITAERAERVHFSESYHSTEISVLVRAGRSEPENLRELKGSLVAAGRATTSEEAVRRSLPEAVLVLERQGELSFVEMLLHGEIDALVLDRPAADRRVDEHPRALRRLEEPVARERYAFAVGPDHADLLTAINAVIERLRQDGSLADWARENGLED